MDGSDSVKDRTTADRGSAASTNNLIIENYDDTIRTNERQTPTKKKSKKSRKKSEQIPTDQPTIRGAFGITRAATVFWYICVFILFIIAFIAIILSIVYFIGDTTTEQVIKLYGICGAGSLAIVTVVIIFLDCCNDRNMKELEEMAAYRMLQAKKAKQKALSMRRSQRIAESKEEKPKPFIIQHQGTQITSNDSNTHPHHHHHSHHVRHHPPLHIHYFHAPPPSYHHRTYVYPASHDLHSAPQNRIDVAVDTSDKFAPISTSKTTIHHSTHDTQTNPQNWDIECGTQTDRTEGTQTSTMELNGIPSNVTQIIHETTILKAPRELLGTLKESMAQQDKDMAFTSDETDSNELIAFM